MQLDPVTGLKKCPRCIGRFPQGRPASEFNRLTRSRDGLYFYCRECMNAEHGDWRRDNPKAVMFYDARRRAKRMNLSFTITREDIFIPDRCPVGTCGRLLVRKVGEQRGGTILSSPSLDRYDPSLGYVPENVWVICYECNSRKQDMSGEGHVAFGMNLIESFEAFSRRVVIE